MTTQVKTYDDNFWGCDMVGIAAITENEAKVLREILSVVCAEIPAAHEFARQLLKKARFADYTGPGWDRYQQVQALLGKIRGDLSDEYIETTREVLREASKPFD